ncbi:MAG: galactokinase [Actinomycetota bacterium]|jgi:galactokinase|nr:galactokinase [Actinomycetota bacterium]
MSPTEIFRQLTGHDPQGVWAAPGRVNLIGEHTDYNEGLVLPFAIEARSEVAAGRRDDGVVRVLSLQKPGDLVEADAAGVGPGQAVGWSAYVLGVVWALRQAGHDVGGADLVLDGRVPSGSGLSSSASVECAAALALAELYGLDLPGERLATLAQQAENDVVGAPTGPMDQRASMLCTEGHALLLDTRDMSTEQVPLNPAASGLALLVVDSRVHHEHTDNAYGDRRRSCEQATSELGLRALRDVPLDGLEETLRRLSTDELRSRVRHVVTDNARTRTVSEALCRGDWTTVGQAMTASHASMRDDYEISCPELDLLVDAALDAGASGARMTGGGFGGCAVVLTRADLVDTVSANVQKAFARAGYDEPRPFVVRPSAGARRLS